MILSILWWYWLIGVLFTCFLIYAINAKGFIEDWYLEYVKEEEAKGEQVLSFKAFEICCWIAWFIFVPFVYPAFFLFRGK